MSRHNCHHNYFIFEGDWRGFFNFEVATSNVEDGSVNFKDQTFVAQFILTIDTMVPLPHKQDSQNPLFPVVVSSLRRQGARGVAPPAHRAGAPGATCCAPGATCQNAKMV